MGENDERDSSRRGKPDEDTSSSSLSDLAEDLSSEDSSDEAPSDEAPSDTVSSEESSSESVSPSSTTSDQSLSLSELAESLRKRRLEGSGSELGGDQSEWDIITQSADDSDSTSGPDPKTEAVLELVGDASNILLSGQTECAAEESLCSRLMSSSTGDPINLLVVTIGQTPGERLSILQNYLSGPVGNTAVIDVQSYDAGVPSEEYDGPVEIKTVQDATDLRRIGILTSKVLSDWEDSPGQTAVCFHSVSDLLKHVDDQQLVFRFLHVLRGRIHAAGARGHYHLDPTSHDTQVVRTFASLFDTVLEFETDGSVSLN
ncbi:hypothetical protein C499_13180 [Halogeometricum borinquense DSM 11551]|uniref:Uncharacterized protein n=1 Tax=Halogeometricum borinquense (strain ATCC 700274 / DSM 11551 / JCM 10706 / KCTC 4070 / PR3) TaxID=469382 RepID=E4NUI1_HALBP|nr:hypothetical protein [Halogeometricum borinquense]ADQ68701.1 hypothetical protein Hbor_31660 [Halogeometricum borinquense DSM 11551]ELY25441.1 hypothetical protein C499_13180 [Halogeometricum borinquense DSM 11551]